MNDAITKMVQEITGFEIERVKLWERRKSEEYLKSRSPRESEAAKKSAERSMKGYQKQIDDFKIGSSCTSEYISELKDLKELGEKIENAKQSIAEVINGLSNCEVKGARAEIGATKNKISKAFNKDVENYLKKGDPKKANEKLAELESKLKECGFLDLERTGHPSFKQLFENVKSSKPSLNGLKLQDFDIANSKGKEGFSINLSRENELNAVMQYNNQMKATGGKSIPKTGFEELKNLAVLEARQKMLEEVNKNLDSTIFKTTKAEIEKVEKNVQKQIQKQTKKFQASNFKQVKEFNEKQDQNRMAKMSQNEYTREYEKYLEAKESGKDFNEIQQIEANLRAIATENQMDNAAIKDAQFQAEKDYSDKKSKRQTEQQNIKEEMMKGLSPEEASYRKGIFEEVKRQAEEIVDKNMERFMHSGDLDNAAYMKAVEEEMNKIFESRREEESRPYEVERESESNKLAGRLNERKIGLDAEVSSRGR